MTTTNDTKTKTETKTLTLTEDHTLLSNKAIQMRSSTEADNVAEDMQFALTAFPLQKWHVPGVTKTSVFVASVEDGDDTIQLVAATEKALIGLIAAHMCDVPKAVGGKHFFLEPFEVVDGVVDPNKWVVVSNKPPVEEMSDDDKAAALTLAGEIGELADTIAEGGVTARACVLGIGARMHDARMLFGGDRLNKQAWGLFTKSSFPAMLSSPNAISEHIRLHETPSKVIGVAPATKTSAKALLSWRDGCVNTVLKGACSTSSALVEGLDGDSAYVTLRDDADFRSGIASILAVVAGVGVDAEKAGVVHLIVDGYEVGVDASKEAERLGAIELGRIAEMVRLDMVDGGNAYDKALLKAMKGARVVSEEGKQRDAATSAGDNMSDSESVAGKGFAAMNVEEKAALIVNMLANQEDGVEVAELVLETMSE